MNKKNIILGFILLLFTHAVYAQKVGINTNTPQTVLDVNGAIRVRKDIKLGGVAGTAGSSGTIGQAFTSQGAGKSPVWSAMGIDTSLGFAITQSTALSDIIGVKYSSADILRTFSPAYEEDSELSAANGWTEITGLRSEVIPTKPNNRLVVTLQTAGQSETRNGPSDVQFQIGVFLDGKLKSTRPLYVSGSSMTFSLGTLFDSFEQLPIKANGDPYVIQVAVAIRYLDSEDSTYDAYLGTSDENVNNTTNAMNMTSLKIDLYEEM